MWTPKRILILIGGLFLFLSGYGAYAFFLGGIDGLPPLPEEYWPRPGPIIVTDPGDPESARKLRLAFGPESEESRRRIILDLRAKGVIVAAGNFEVVDGKVELSPCSVALFPKGRPDAKFPEINTIVCEIAYLTFDQPVTKEDELVKRKIVAVEMRGGTEGGKAGVTLTNNRGTPEKNDDIEVHIAGAPVFYEEKENKIWSEGVVKLLDLQSQPKPTDIRGQGLEVRLSPDTGPNRKPPKTGAKAKSEGVSGVELIKLNSNVDMHLWVENRSGFLAVAPDNNKKPAAPPLDPKAGGDSKAPGDPKAPVEKSQIVIKTIGPFHYDLTTERAWFDSPQQRKSNSGGTDHTPQFPEQVEVTREHPATKKLDQLICNHLELQFRRKTTAEKAAAEPMGARDATGDKEIETAVATARAGEEVVLSMDSEVLEATGSELHYRCASATTGPQTILKGNPVRAVKDANKIVAYELHLIGADKNGNGQKAFARGPGQIDLFDKTTKQYPTHALWKDTLISVKEREGERVLDLLTLTGDASWTDEARKQDLRAERLQVWSEQLTPAESEKLKGNETAASGVSRQRLHKIVAEKNVSARSEDFIIKHTDRLTILFKHLPAVDEVLPPGKDGIKDGAKDPKDPAAVGKSDEPAKQRKPIVLSAGKVDANVIIRIGLTGDKNELQDLFADRDVEVHQDGETPKDKGVDIAGTMLNLVAHPTGNTLMVFGDSAQKPARLYLGELILAGPKVTIDQVKNVAEVNGAGGMEMPSNANFDGTKPVKPGTKLRVFWTDYMFFDGKSADFDGSVQAYQDTGSMKCSKLTVTLDRVVTFKQGQKEGEPAKVEEILCERKVLVQDSQLDANGKIQQYSSIQGTEVHVNNRDGDAKAVGDGVAIYIAPGSSENPIFGPGAPKPDPKAKEKMVLNRTTIEYRDRAYSKTKETSRNAKFYGDVKVYHMPLPEGNPNAPINRDKAPKDGFYLRCELLDVYTRPVDGKACQMMEARRQVSFRTDEFFGTSDLVKYDESQEHVIFEGTPGNPATLFKLDPRGGQPQRIQGSKILYNRKTGIFKAEGVTSITSWLIPDGTPQSNKRANGEEESSGYRSLALARLDANRQDEPFVSLGLISRYDW